MILVRIATALAIGAYVVLSKDAQPKRPDATPRESFHHPADHLLDRGDRPEPSARFRTTFFGAVKLTSVIAIVESNVIIAFQTAADRASFSAESGITPSRTRRRIGT
jgi:hypothetical protein